MSKKVDSEGIVLGRTTHKSYVEFNSAYESEIMGLQGPILKTVFGFFSFLTFFIFHLFGLIFQGECLLDAIG